MTILKTLTMFTFLALGFTSSKAQTVKNETLITKQNSIIMDSTMIKTLVITKVKKPWYAWRSLVVGKMKKSIPDFQKVEGLKEKYFSFTNNHKKFGGLYLWDAEENAKQFFNQAWFERIEKKYGEKGIVNFYKVATTQTFATTFNSSAKELYAAISYNKDEKFSKNDLINGLIKIYNLKDNKNQTCYLTLWQYKEQAINYFKNETMTNDFFEIPLFIDNK